MCTSKCKEFAKSIFQFASISHVTSQSQRRAKQSLFSLSAKWKGFFFLFLLAGIPPVFFWPSYASVEIDVAVPLYKTLLINLAIHRKKNYIC